MSLLFAAIERGDNTEARNVAYSGNFFPHMGRTSTVITRAEAERVAARWARSESSQRGYDCEPVLDEFPLGFVISTRQPPTILPVPGDGARTVIDRETGVVSTWPAIPLDDLAARYRARRPAPTRTLDPAAAIRRAAHRSPSPTSVAHLTVDGRLFRAQGAKGDQRITHHPLVAAYLSTVEDGARVRGAERHAELIALSDALYSTVNGITLDEARAWLVRAEFATYLVRETGDPSGGRPARPCETCIGALVDFALLPWSDLAFTTEWRHGSDRIPQPGRFPHEVARTLAGGGWASPKPGGGVGSRDGGRGAGNGLGPRLGSWGGAGSFDGAGSPDGAGSFDGAGPFDGAAPVEGAAPVAGAAPREGAFGEGSAGSADRRAPGEVLGEAAIDRAVELSGGRLRPFEAARRIAAEFPGVRCGRRGPGLRRAVRLLTIEPSLGAYAATALEEFAQLIGVPLFPIGIEGGDGIVAVDEVGRIFVLDQGGEWFVGQTIDEALVSLLAGDGPATRVHDDGTW